MPRQQDDVEVLDKVLEESTGGRDYIVETQHGDITFSMSRVSRVRRQEFLSALPDGLVDAMADQEDEQTEDLDVEELSDLDEIQDGQPDDVPSDAVVGPDEVDEFQSLILDSFDHPNITDHELAELMEYWSDEMFYGTAFLIVSFSADTEGVDGFRTE